MKIFKLPKLAESSVDGSFCLGQREINSNAVYMLYTRLRPGEAPKMAVPASGAEEIILVIKGNIRVRCGKMDFVVGPGEAFHSKECEAFQLENIGSDEAVFITAGGRGGKPADAIPEQKAQDADKPQAENPEAAEKEEPEFFITREDEP